MTRTKIGGGGPSPTFSEDHVSSAMHPGVVSCTPETSLREVAQIMAEQAIHSVVIGGLRTRSSERSWGVVSDVDLLRAAAGDLETQSAGDVAATELPTVRTDDSLPRAAQIMAEHEVTHLIVVDPDDGQAVGVLSSLDLAASLAAGDS